MVKSNGKEPTTLIFNDFTLGLGEAELCFRLVHLWDAQNTSRGGRMRGFIDWVFHLPNLMASSSILLLESDPFSRENEEKNNQCMIFSLSFLIPFVSLLNDDLWNCSSGAIRIYMNMHVTKMKWLK
ncbi:hypothetical protein Bca4012_072668 [Brassica carinata]